MYERLYTAWRRFKKGKRLSRAIDTFAYQLESELYVLAHDIDLRAYRHGGYQAVTVREKKTAQSRRRRCARSGSTPVCVRSACRRV